MLHGSIDELSDLRERIEETIVAEPPISLSDGGVIQAGVGQRTRRSARPEPQQQAILAQIEQRERERTGIASLKVKFNNDLWLLH